jgi:hypothetical protein
MRGEGRPDFFCREAAHQKGLISRAGPANLRAMKTVCTITCCIITC